MPDVTSRGTAPPIQTASLGHLSFSAYWASRPTGTSRPSRSSSPYCVRWVIHEREHPVVKGDAMSTDRTRVQALLTEVTGFLARMAAPQRHHIACGLLLHTNDIVLGVNIVSSLGPASVCAEQIALGEALKRSAGRVDLVVSLRARFGQHGLPEVVPPCGRCRELLVEYADTAEIVLPGPETDGLTGSTVAPIATLLPHPFRRRVPPASSGPTRPQSAIVHDTSSSR